MHPQPGKKLEEDVQLRELQEQEGVKEPESRSQTPEVYSAK
jgi:hypothetical protein